MSTANTPPSPDGVPLLGNGLAFSRAPFDALSDWAEEGDVVRLRFPGRSMYLMTGPDLIETVLVEEQDAFTIGREQRRTFAGVEDDAVTANTGDRWKRLRRRGTPGRPATVHRQSMPMTGPRAWYSNRSRSSADVSKGYNGRTTI